MKKVSSCIFRLMNRRFSRLFAVLFLFPPMAFNSYSQDNIAEEYKIKAVCLVKLINFVEWPEGKNASDQQIKNICVLGQSPLAVVMADLSKKQGLFKTKKLNDLSQISDCDVIYVSESEQGVLSDVISTASKKKILAVSDTRDFAANGGIVELILINDQIGFIVNNQVAQDIGFKIDRRLLALAKFVIQ